MKAMVGTRNFLIVCKIFFSLLGLTAVATEITVLLQRGQFSPTNFFSFFTVLSNVFAAVVLSLSASRSQARLASGFALVRGAAALYMATTGIVFSVLLSGLDSDVLTAVPWDNIVLHYIMPVAVVLDWALDSPGVRLTFRRALVWVVFPMAYLAYSLVRGAITGWYPYPFLDPREHGYTGVLVVSAAVTALVLALAAGMVRIGRRGLAKAARV